MVERDDKQPFNIARQAPYDMLCGRCGTGIPAGAPQHRIDGVWICSKHVTEKLVRE